jgi:hypothetical protein
MAKSSGGKGGAKAAPGRRAAGQKDASQKARLLKELEVALPQIDEAGLLFLLRQAQVLIHNAAVDRLNREEVELEASRAASPKASARPPAAGVSIEDPEGGKPVFVALGKVRKVLSPEEVQQLVRICCGDEPRTETLSRLFKVLSRERRDILTDAGISGAASPLLAALYAAVRTRYKAPVKEA